jgi:hypothetical protein
MTEPESSLCNSRQGKFIQCLCVFSSAALLIVVFKLFFGDRSLAYKNDIILAVQLMTPLF